MEVNEKLNLLEHEIEKIARTLDKTTQGSSEKIRRSERIIETTLQARRVSIGWCVSRGSERN